MYVLHIKTSQVEKAHHLYIFIYIYIYLYIYLFILKIMPFLHFEAHGFWMVILFYNFCIDFIEVFRYFKFVMIVNPRAHIQQKTKKKVIHLKQIQL